MCLCEWVNGDNDLLLLLRLAYPRQQGAKFGASWIIPACNAPPPHGTVNQWSIPFNAARIHEACALENFRHGSWAGKLGTTTETPSLHHPAPSQDQCPARTHAHTHTHTHSPTHPTHQSISTRTYLLTHHVPKISFLHTISVFLCVSLWVCLVCVSLSVSVCLWFLLFGCPQFAAFIPPPSHLGSKWKTLTSRGKRAGHVFNNFQILKTHWSKKNTSLF